MAWLKQKKISGLSLIEIIVSMVILSLVLVGFANLFILGKRYTLHSRSRMAGGELGRYFLDPLQVHVRQSSWDTVANDLRERTYNGSPVSIAGISYTPRYNISNITVGSSSRIIRKVQLNLTWNETSP